MDSQNHKESERFLSVKEVAGMLRQSDDTVRRWIHSGVIVAVVIQRRRNNCYLIPESKLDDVLKRNLNVRR